VVIGVLFGAIFAAGARKFCAGLERYMLAGTGYGIAIWVVNFYGILSWLQPLLHGGAFILTEIPIAVAVVTHVCYGLTVALVWYVLQRDLRRGY
jgi:NO-binding membrane sensor protein with MHYT domain